MTSDLDRVRRIVKGALALKGEDRDSFVRSSCAGNAQLMAEVMSSLRSGELSDPNDSPDRGGDADRASGGSATEQGPQVGSRLGDLSLVKELGSGQQGRVYEAYQGTLDRHVAVKILAAGAGSSSEQADRFHREAEAAGRLNHPNIVAIHEILERQGSLLIVQELVEGRTLEEILVERESQPGTLDAVRCRWAADMCRQLARGLQQAHEHRVIHRDVKPANVLVTVGGVPKLTDFGLALMQDRFALTQTGSVLGTPKYMAPEQIESSHQELDARADVYALGAILYRMLTGHVPFTARTIQALFRDILTRAPRSPRSLHLDVPRDLEAVCLKCLEKDKAARYASAGELADDLQRFLAGEATAARPLGLINSADRALRRLAVSTLLAVSLLFPAVWFALDAAWLSPWADRDPGVHDIRLGLLAFFVLFTIWPVARLFRRMVHGRRVATAASLSLVLLAGSAGFWSIHDDARHHGHIMAREALEAQLSTVADHSVDTLVQYVADWGERFDPLDWQLMARGYLLAQRAPMAQHWVDKLTEQDPENPVSMAFAYVLEDLFGSSSAAATIEQRLWATAGGVNDWILWKNAGQVLGDARRFELAQRAYGIALTDPDVRMHRLSPDLAQASLDLCQYERAWDELRVTLAALPDDSVLQLRLFHISCRAAIGLRNWEAAADQLARFESLPDVSHRAVLDLRFELLTAQGRSDEASALVKGVASTTDVEFELLWCGQKALAISASAMSAGDIRSYMESLTLMQDCFERLLDTRPDSVSAHVGLAAALISLAGVQPEADVKRQLLARAETLSARAVKLDDNLSEAYGNLSYARRELALLEYGGFDQMPASAIRRFLNPMRKALERDSLSPEILNDTAYGLTLLYELEPDRSLLNEALDDIRRSIRLRKGADASACGKWAYLNYLYDTQRSVQERAGDLQAALQSARLAVEAAEDVHSDPERIAGLHAHEQRLARLVGALQGDSSGER